MNGTTNAWDSSIASDESKSGHEHWQTTNKLYSSQGQIREAFPCWIEKLSSLLKNREYQEGYSS